MLRPRLLWLALASAGMACGSTSATAPPGDDSGATPPSGGSGGGASSGSSSSGGSGTGGSSSSSSGAGSSGGPSGGSSSSGATGSSGAGGSSSGSGSGGGGGITDASTGAADTSVRDAARPDATRDAGADATAAGDAQAQPKITLWLAGDSTMADVSPATPTFFGWGQQFAPFFDANVTVRNLAIGGRSIAFFMFQVERDDAGAYLCTDATGDPDYVLDGSGNRVPTSQWAAIQNGMAAGDSLFIQFGTNDATDVCPRHVSIADYETDLGVMAAAARAKGATPIFLTPVSQLSCGTGTPVATLTDYAAAARAASQTYSAPLIDLNTLSVQFYDSLGCTATTADIFAAGQATHFTMPGAVDIAQIVAKALGPIGSPLAARVK